MFFKKVFNVITFKNTLMNMFSINLDKYKIFV